MRAFLIIHLCDKMPGAYSDLSYILIRIAVNFFRIFIKRVKVFLDIRLASYLFGQKNRLRKS